MVLITYMENKITVLDPKSRALNGIVYYIDGVIIPKDTGISTTTTEMISSLKVIDALKEDGNFDMFVGLIDELDLTDSLNNAEKDLTILAPEDSAFDLLPEGYFEDMTKGMDWLFPNLKNFLTYNLFSKKDPDMDSGYGTPYLEYSDNF